MAQKRPLTAKQQAFIDYYTDPNSDTYNNAYQSAIKAKYSANYAKVHSCHLLDNVRVKQAIDAKIAKRQAKIEYNYETAITELNEQIENLKPLALARNISAVSAITALLREKNDITGLHKQNIHRTGEVDVPVMSEEEAKAMQDIARQYKIRLAGTRSWGDV